MMARYSRAEALFGVSSHVQQSLKNSDDASEFKEEDLWETDHARGWPLEAEDAAEIDSAQQLDHHHHQAHGGYGYGGYGGSGGGGQGHNNNNNGMMRIATTTDSSESFRFFNNGRRWLGLEKDPGLSVAFADSTTPSALGLSSLSPLVKHNNSNHAANGMMGCRETGSTTPARIPTVAASRMMMSPAAGAPVGFLQHQSAPANVPDWSKILGSEKKAVSAWGTERPEYYDDDEDVVVGAEEAGERLVPPHELLAREYANSQATTFSVFEGAGRTLKGRDLSRVRNAVLRKTGFIDF